MREIFIEMREIRSVQGKQARRAAGLCCGVALDSTWKNIINKPGLLTIAQKTENNKNAELLKILDVFEINHRQNFLFQKMV